MEQTLTDAPTHELVLQLETERQVHSFDLKDKFRVAIGRHPSSDVQLRSNRVSNYHAEILNEVDGLIIRDIGSTNGTFLNGNAVTRQRLKNGDSIRIGSFDIEVRLQAREDEDFVSPTPFGPGTTIIPPMN